MPLPEEHYSAAETSPQPFHEPHNYGRQQNFPTRSISLQQREIGMSGRSGVQHPCRWKREELSVFIVSAITSLRGL
jgi:hypothetical protein